MNISEYINTRITEVINSWATIESDDISDSVSFGELVDKLTVCNIRLVKVEEEQAQLKEKASVCEEVDLVYAFDLTKESITLGTKRSLTKRAIDLKLRQIIKSCLSNVEETI